MTSTTEDRSGGADGAEPGSVELTTVIPLVPWPRHAQPDPVPHRTAPTSAPPWLNPTARPVAFPMSLEPPAGLQAGYDPREIRLSGMRWGWVVVGAVLAAALLVAVAAAHQTMAVRGSVTLHVTWSTVAAGDSCSGAGSYSWLQPGTSVTISDANGKIVGTSTLRSGTAFATGRSYYGADTCVFPFTLNDVPAGDDFYRVGVGNLSSDGVPFTAAQLRTSGATIAYGP